MTHLNEFLEYDNRVFQIYDLRPINNKLFYLINEEKSCLFGEINL